MDTWPGSSAVSASRIAATHRKRMFTIVIVFTLLFAGLLAYVVTFEARTMAPIPWIALMIGIASAVANYQIASTAKCVALDLEAAPDARAWRLQLVLLGGARLKTGLSCFLVANASEYTVYLNGRVMEKGTSTIIQDGPVTRSDFVVTQGKRAGQTVQQITTIQDDLLLGCAAAPGNPRPDGFSSTAENRQTLSLWTKVTA